MSSYANNRKRRAKAEKRFRHVKSLAAKELPELRTRRQRLLEQYKDDPAVIAELERQAVSLARLTRLAMEGSPE